MPVSQLVLCIYLIVRGSILYVIVAKEEKEKAVRTTSSTCLAGADDRVRRLFKETMAAAPPPTAPAATRSTILTYTQYYGSKAETLVGRYDSYRLLEQPPEVYRLSANQGNNCTSGLGRCKTKLGL